MSEEKTKLKPGQTTLQLPRVFWRPSIIDTLFLLLSVLILTGAFFFTQAGSAPLEAIRNAIPFIAIVIALYPNVRRDAQDRQERAIQRAVTIRDQMEHALKAQIAMTVELKSSINLVRRWLEDPVGPYEQMNTSLPKRPVCEACIAKIDDLPMGLLQVLVQFEGLVEVQSSLLKRHPADLQINADNLKGLLRGLLETLEKYHAAMEGAKIDVQPYLAIKV